MRSRPSGLVSSMSRDLTEASRFQGDDDSRVQDMAGTSPLTVTATQRAALRILAGPRDRGEAGRDRAVLLTLTGWTSLRIAETFGVREDTARLWRSDFISVGIEALRATVAPGPAPVKSVAALRVALPLLAEPVADRHIWTIPRLRAKIEMREGVRIRRSQLSKAGRQVAAEVGRVGLRLRLRKQQAKAGDIALLYGDESEALTHPYLARVWAKAGADLRVPTPGQAKIAMLGSFDRITRQLIVHTSPTKRSSDFLAHLEQLDQSYGPKPSQFTRPVVLVLDNDPIHMSKISLAALAARAHWLTVEWLPQKSPGAERHRGRLATPQGAYLAHQTFADTDALDTAIYHAVDALNIEHTSLPRGIAYDFSA